MIYEDPKQGNFDDKPPFCTNKKYQPKTCSLDCILCGTFRAEKKNNCLGKLVSQLNDLVSERKNACSSCLEAEIELFLCLSKKKSLLPNPVQVTSSISTSSNRICLNQMYFAHILNEAELGFPMTS